MLFGTLPTKHVFSMQNQESESFIFLLMILLIHVHCFFFAGVDNNTLHRLPGAHLRFIPGLLGGEGRQG